MSFLVALNTVSMVFLVALITNSTNLFVALLKPSSVLTKCKLIVKEKKIMGLYL